MISSGLERLISHLIFTHSEEETKPERGPTSEMPFVKFPILASI
jgi:hypothetical protein